MIMNIMLKVLKECEKINWGILKCLRVYLSNNQFQSGSAKPEVVRSAPLPGAQGENFKEKRHQPSTEIILLAMFALFGKAPLFK